MKRAPAKRSSNGEVPAGLPVTPKLRAPSLEFLETSDEATGLPVGAAVWVGPVAYGKRAITGKWTMYEPGSTIYQRHCQNEGCTGCRWCGILEPSETVTATATEDAS